MKLGTLRDGTRDGTLVVVSRDLSRFLHANHVAPTLQAALDDWQRCGPPLESLFREVNSRRGAHDLSLDRKRLMAPLPRAFQWADGSAYLSHGARVRRARGAELPPAAHKDPMMYQGGSDAMLGAHDDLVIANEDWGIDIEGEVAVVTDDVPMGVSCDQAHKHVRLLMLANDVTLRNLVSSELAKGFGFFNSKSWTSFSPVAVTPDELGDAWDGTRLHLPLVVHVNGRELGHPDAGRDMHFDFAQLIEHAARTRPLGAGTIIGSGTVSTEDRSSGCTSLAEQRALETIDTGTSHTPYLRFGDTVRIDMPDRQGLSIFGAIEQTVVPQTPK